TLFQSIQVHSLRSGVIPLGLALALRPDRCSALSALFPSPSRWLHFTSRFAFLSLLLPKQIQLPAVCFDLKKLSLSPRLFTTAFLDQPILRQHLSDTRCAHLFMPCFPQ